MAIIKILLCVSDVPGLSLELSLASLREEKVAERLALPIEELDVDGFGDG